MFPGRSTDRPGPRPRALPGRARRRLAPAIAAVCLAALVPAVLTVARADAAPAPQPPQGRLLSVTKSGAGIAVSGWAVPTRTSDTALVRIEINGAWAGRLVARRPVRWLPRTWPMYSADHGYTATFPLDAGTYRVCAFVVLDPKVRGKRPVGCRSITLAYNPLGTVDVPAVTPGRVSVAGWTVDPDAVTTPITATLALDGRTVATTTAAATDTRATTAVAGAGSAHGYRFTVPITEGRHRVCVTAANLGPGTDTSLGCRRLRVSFSPTAAVDTLAVKPAALAVGGWAVDPDTSATTTVDLTLDGAPLASGLPASRPKGARPGHGFYRVFGEPTIASGSHVVCVVAHNLGSYGEDSAPACTTETLSWSPTTTVTRLVQRAPGATIAGWAVDPDTSSPVQVRITEGRTLLTTVTAGIAGPANSAGAGHFFTATVPLKDGTHTLCAAAVNVMAGGSAPATPVCRTVTVRLTPVGSFQAVSRATGSTAVVATGWAVDPNTAAPITVEVRLGSGPWTAVTANLQNPAAASAFPGASTAHGFSLTLPAKDTEYTLCARADNVPADGTTVSLGCKIINAVNPTVPAAPGGVTAVAGYGGAQVTWTAPTSDGGAPWSGYTVTAQPGGVSTTVGPGTLAATVLGLQPNTSYTFSVVATNVVGPSAATTSPAARTEKAPPAQTTPAPISTSRYIRNIHGSASSDLTAMRNEGLADATANPSGHGYLVLLDIGGQVEASQGVILSAGIRFVSYADLVKCLDSYVDGYAAKQRPSAPVTIALGTNNDIDVSRSSGASWASHVVAPVVKYAARYPGITIAGANDIEPGFRAGVSATRAWLTGYLGATRAPFVFNGSADGCAWTVPGKGCNNGWTMRDLDWLAGGAAPVRIVNLPQIYNTTMAAQWRYISLTGVQAGLPKINFGGALTEYTACRQAGGCGSLTGTTAWTTMWNQLRAQPELKPTSLPYSTDLRIDS